MTGATKLTTKGQVVIPKRLREALRWRPGTRLVVEMADGAVRLRQLPRRGVSAEGDAIDRAFGMFRGGPGDPIAELEVEHRAEIAADERRTRRP